MPIKLVLPQAAQLGILLFVEKTVLLHPLKVPVSGRITKDTRRKKPRILWNQTHTLSVMRCALYHYATTVAPH